MLAIILKSPRHTNMGLSPGNVVCMHWVFSGYFKVAAHETMNGIGNAHYVQFLLYLQHALQIDTVSYGNGVRNALTVRTSALLALLSSRMREGNFISIPDEKAIFFFKARATFCLYLLSWPDYILYNAINTKMLLIHYLSLQQKV